MMRFSLQMVNHLLQRWWTIITEWPLLILQWCLKALQFPLAILQRDHSVKISRTSSLLHLCSSSALSFTHHLKYSESNHQWRLPPNYMEEAKGGRQQWVESLLVTTVWPEGGACQEAPQIIRMPSICKMLKTLHSITFSTTLSKIASLIQERWLARMEVPNHLVIIILPQGTWLWTNREGCSPLEIPWLGVLSQALFKGPHRFLRCKLITLLLLTTRALWLILPLSALTFTAISYRLYRQTPLSRFYSIIIRCFLTQVWYATLPLEINLRLRNHYRWITTRVTQWCLLRFQQFRSLSSLIPAWFLATTTITMKTV